MERRIKMQIQPVRDVRDRVDVDVLDGQGVHSRYSSSADTAKIQVLAKGHQI